MESLWKHEKKEQDLVAEGESEGRQYEIGCSGEASWRR